MSDTARQMLAGLTAATRLSVPDGVAATLVEQGEALGAEKVTVFLVDPEQYYLMPLPVGEDAEREPLKIDATLAGRCYRDLQQQDSDGGREVWIPLLDGLERLGVLQLHFSDVSSRAGDELLHQFAAAVAEIIIAKTHYGDHFTLVRRRDTMSLAGEIAWNLMPPLTFGTDRVVISCMLAPAYQVGGDSFDYAVDGRIARLAVFDAMGHGLSAGLLATVAVAAYRQARRCGLGLIDTAQAIDRAVAGSFEGEHFVTAVLLELDLTSGVLAWHSAGHPAPLLLRGTRVVKTLKAKPGLPLGVAGTFAKVPELGVEELEPGDRVLLYSDGVVEARDADGRFFGIDRLGDLVGREAAAGQPAPETMRRLMHAILDHQAGALQDDATTVLLEWRTGGQQRLVPDEVS